MSGTNETTHRKDFKGHLAAGVAAVAVLAHAHAGETPKPSIEAQHSVHFSPSARLALGLAPVQHLQQRMLHAQRDIAVVSEVDMEPGSLTQTRANKLHHSLSAMGVQVTDDDIPVVKGASHFLKKNRGFSSYHVNGPLCLIVVPSPAKALPAQAEFNQIAELPASFKVGNAKLQAGLDKLTTGIVEHEAEHCDQQELPLAGAQEKGYISQREAGSDHALHRAVPASSALITAARSIAPLHLALQGRDANIHATVLTQDLSLKQNVALVKAASRPNDQDISKYSDIAKTTGETYESLARKATRQYLADKTQPQDIAAKAVLETAPSFLPKSLHNYIVEKAHPYVPNVVRNFAQDIVQIPWTNNPIMRNLSESFFSRTAAHLSARPEVVTHSLMQLQQSKQLNNNEAVAARLYVDAVNNLNGQPAAIVTAKAAKPALQ